MKISFIGLRKIIKEIQRVRCFKNLWNLWEKVVKIWKKIMVLKMNTMCNGVLLIFQNKWLTVFLFGLNGLEKNLARVETPKRHIWGHYKMYIHNFNFLSQLKRGYMRGLNSKNKKPPETPHFWAARRCNGL